MTHTLFSQIDFGGDCWEWLGSRTDRYGRHDGQAAHRVVYELLVGSILDGLELDHLCRNGYCVKPDHLEPVTHKENVLRGNAYAALQARRACCPNGHTYDHTDSDGRRRCRACRRIVVREAMRRFRLKEVA